MGICVGKNSGESQKSVNIEESDYLGKLDIDYDLFNAKDNLDEKVNSEEMDSFDKKIKGLNL